jgi:HIP---CoA ligase
MDDGLRGDLRWGTIPALVDARAEESGERTAIVDVDRTLTYEELRLEARRFAKALLAVGVERGDRVAIWAPNQWRWVVAALGAHFAGAQIVPVNTRFKGAEAAHLLGATRPKVLVMVESFLGVDYPRLLSDIGFTPPTGFITVMTGEATTAGTGFEEFAARGEDVAGDALDTRVARARPSDPSDILFTSGTTASPKGVVTDHGQNLRAYYDWSTLAGMRDGDRYAIIPPFFHAFGYKVGWLSSVMHGITMYPHAALDVPMLLDQIQHERITILSGPPALFGAVLEHAAERQVDLASLRVAIIGAATIPPVLVRRMKDELGFDRITTCYGLTEATGVATISRQDDPLAKTVTTAGRAVPGVELGVLPADGTPARPLGEGEIVVRGYNVMRGYLAAEDNVASPVDQDGWLHTGDVGRIDELGYLRVTDRKKDMFIVSGFNASPAEIEKTLMEHPGIEQAAVIGVPDERLGEVGMAFVVPRQPPDVTESSVIAWCEERLANFKVPRRVVLVPDLPRNATGKVVKDDLRRLARLSPPAGTGRGSGGSGGSGPPGSWPG